MYKNGKMCLLNVHGLIGNRITWQEVGSNVRQTWETTEDGGSTWKVAFDGEYRRD